MNNDERYVRDQVQRNLIPQIPTTLDFTTRQRLENAAASEKARVAESKKK